MAIDFEPYIKILNWSNLKGLLIQFGKHLFFGLLIILGGIFLYMICTISIGYLPYSDRPGPGWYKKPFGISWEEINYIWDFILLLGVYILGVLVIVYLLFRLFRLIGYNGIVYSILGGLIIGFLSFYVTLGIGWYIAIDDSTVLIGGILGLIYGAILFPKFLRPIKRVTR
jgi:hypothetical protein